MDKINEAKKVSTVGGDNIINQHDFGSIDAGAVSVFYGKCIAHILLAAVAAESALGRGLCRSDQSIGQGGHVG